MAETIKFMPWLGPNNEIEEGKKTRITLLIDHLEFKMEHTQKVTLERMMGKDEGERFEAKNFVKEEGTIGKDAIVGISKYIETNYDKDTNPHIIHLLDIVYGGSTATFTFSTEEEKDNAYKTLNTWKYGA